MTKSKWLSPVRFQYITWLLMVAAHYYIPLQVIINAPWTYLGVLPYIAGILFNYFSDKWFDKYETTFNPFIESKLLITEGLYQYTRNPMYLGFVVTLLGLAVFLGSLSPFIVVIIFAVAIGRTFIRVEEAMLADQFGEEWDAYQKRVRRWI